MKLTHSNIHSDTAVCQTIHQYRFVREHLTVASLPLEAATHAEFCFASTSHVVATLFELNGDSTIVASLPAFRFCKLDEFFCGSIVGAFARGMPFIVTRTAYFRAALFANAELAAVSKVAGLGFDLAWWDPFAAPSRWTVNPVLGGKLLEFCVPLLLELGVIQISNALQRDGFFVRAAFRGHVLCFNNRKIKSAFQTVVTHSVTTRELWTFRDRFCIRQTSVASDTVDYY